MKGNDNLASQRLSFCSNDQVWERLSLVRAYAANYFGVSGHPPDTVDSD